MRAASPLIIAATLYVKPSWVYGAWLWDMRDCILLEVVSSGKRAEGEGAGVVFEIYLGRFDRNMVVLKAT